MSGSNARQSHVPFVALLNELPAAEAPATLGRNAPTNHRMRGRLRPTEVGKLELIFRVWSSSFCKLSRIGRSSAGLPRLPLQAAQAGGHGGSNPAPGPEAVCRRRPGRGVSARIVRHQLQDTRNARRQIHDVAGAPRWPRPGGGRQLRCSAGGLDQVSVSDLGALLLLDGDSDACRRMLSAGQPGRLLRASSVASFLGCADLQLISLISLAGLLRGSSETEMERVCGVDDGYPFGPAVAQLIGSKDLSEAHLAELSARVAVNAEQRERQQVVEPQPAEPEPEAAGEPEPETAEEPVTEGDWTTLHLEQTDADTILGLLAALDIATCLRRASASFATCSVLFLDHRFAFRAWSAVLQPISSVGITVLETGVDQSVDLLSAEAGEGCDWCQQLIELIRMSQDLQHCLTLTSGLTLEPVPALTKTPRLSGWPRGPNTSAAPPTRSSCSSRAY